MMNTKHEHIQSFYCSSYEYLYPTTTIKLNKQTNNNRYHPNNSMGAKKGVDATPIYDSESDGGWSDEDAED
jgi:hypothetical protein